MGFSLGNALGIGAISNPIVGSNVLGAGALGIGPLSDIFGGGPNYGNPSADILARLSQDYYNQTQPLRTSLIGRSNNFLSGGLDVTQSPMYGALKSGIEGQFGTAKNNIMSSLPQGGALLEALSNLEGQKASSLATGIGGLASDELTRAYGLGTGGAGTALGGLGNAAGLQGQSLLAQAQNRSQMLGGLGQGLGSILAMAML